jgi:hypothetical protein
MACCGGSFADQTFKNILQKIKIIKIFGRRSKWTICRKYKFSRMIKVIDDSELNYYAVL